jgi:ribosomal protein S12 methylthiotransferase
MITLGCSKNTVDSEVLAARFAKHGFTVSFEYTENAEVVIVNTCGFIGDAKQESIETILSYIELKRSGALQKVMVMGCLIQRYATEMAAEMPEVDGFFGVTDFDAMLKSLSLPVRNYEVEQRLLSTPSHYAYLKISEGCDRRCAFCAIPIIRGHNASRTIESLLDEARSLGAHGVKELNIIAQDTTSYGLDLYGKRMLAPLLEQLDQLNMFEWIRLHYTFPAGFPTEVMDVMAAHPNICNYIDIPLQHISERILRSMKRGLYGSGTRKLLDTLRQRIPGVAIRTAFIVGYPGETRKEFNELMRFVSEQRFDRAGVFTYSAEEGTAAYGLKDTVTEKTKHARAAELMEVQQEISATINQSRIGTTMKVLIDRLEGEYYVGRTEYDSPEVDNEVLIAGSAKKLKVGNFYQVKITGAEAFDLLGKL